MRQPPRVNSKPVKLGQHARIILLLLAARAIESPGDYFKTDEILRELTRRERILGALHLSWVKPTEAQLHSAISELRQALEDCGLDRNLIESVHGKGYRLSTPAMNILGDDSAPDNFTALLPLFPQHGGIWKIDRQPKDLNHNWNGNHDGDAPGNPARWLLCGGFSKADHKSSPDRSAN